MRMIAGILGCLGPLSTAAAQGVPAPIPAAPAPGTPAALPYEFQSLVVRDRPQPPAYPPLARIANLEGTVLLRLVIGAGGRVEGAEALEGPALLRSAAEAYLRAWTFQPVLVEGAPTRVQCELRVPFRLGSLPAADPVQPPTKAVVQVVQDPQGGAAALEAAPLQAEIKALLDRAGLRQVEASEAEPWDTFHLKLEVRTLRMEGLSLCQTSERCSLWGDRDLAENEPGKPLRIGFLGHVVGQKGEAGFQKLVQATVRETLEELLVPPPPRPRAVPGEKGAGRKPGPAAQAGAGSGPVDFDFSQIKIRYQPPAPPYPVYAKRNHVQGTVVVTLTVDPEGVPVHAEAEQGPMPLLLTALGYALAWRFEPARLNGVPQYARFRLTMPFRLR